MSLSGLTDKAKRWIRDVIAAQIGLRAITSTSDDGASDALEGAATTPDEPDYTEDAQRVETYGLHSAPPPGCKAVMLLVRGGSGNVVYLGGASPKFKPKRPDGASWTKDDVGIYHQSGSSIWFDNDGNIRLFPKAGKDVLVDEPVSPAKVSRVGDHTSGHSHGVGTLSGSVVVPPGGAGGTFTVTITGSTASATDTMAEGAAHFKA